METERVERDLQEKKIPAVPRSQLSQCVHTYGAKILSLVEYNCRSACVFILIVCNESGRSKLSPSCPQAFVDKLLTVFHVGDSQRREIKQWRGFPWGAFGYNESPTSSCHTFCWKARQKFDVPFF